MSGVLEGYLAQQKEKYSGSSDSDGPWLVGNKFSYADAAFVSWQRIITFILEKDDYNEDNFPLVKEWLGRMTSRKGVKTALDSAQELK